MAASSAGQLSLYSTVAVHRSEAGMLSRWMSFCLSLPQSIVPAIRLAPRISCSTLSFPKYSFPLIWQTANSLIKSLSFRHSAEREEKEHLIGLIIWLADNSPHESNYIESRGTVVWRRARSLYLAWEIQKDKFQFMQLILGYVENHPMKKTCIYRQAWAMKLWTHL